MRAPERTARCASAREWFSAHRDSEAFDDDDARDHISSCAACAAWTAAADAVTRQVRLRAAGSPDVVEGALVAWERAAVEGAADRQRGAGRILLAVAGIAGMALSGLAIVGLPVIGSVTDHFGRDLAGLQAAIAVGFLLAARSPQRYARGLVPVAVASVLVVHLPSAADATRVQLDLLAEAAHLPLLIGLVGLILLFDPTRHALRGREVPA